MSNKGGGQWWAILDKEYRITFNGNDFLRNLSIITVLK
jgi:hypothetical protein